MNIEELKIQLDKYYHDYHNDSFVMSDPVQFPRRYTRLQDIEIVALLTSTIAWGKREMILRSCEKLFAEMGDSPYDYVMEEKYLIFDSEKNIHRTFFGRDFQYICRGLRHMYQQHATMEDIFLENKSDMWKGIENLRNLFIEANDGQSSRHISNPAKSACKRLHMMLRWLVRKDSSVDMGVWTHIDMSALQIPLDVHVARMALHFQLTTRTSNDRKTVEEITQQLRTLSPHDPIRYDYALFGFGVNNQ